MRSERASSRSEAAAEFQSWPVATSAAPTTIAGSSGTATWPGKVDASAKKSAHVTGAAAPGRAASANPTTE